MAIDHIPYPENHRLAHSDQKTFYPVRIPVSHWQLRHFISSPEHDLLFYASGHDIYCLNTATKKRKHIATLPFEARCTASGYGYVCVGGEDDGHFATIKLEGSGARSVDVDEALPIDDRWRRTQSQQRRDQQSEIGDGMDRRAASVKVERIGEEIVNSISIHRIQDEDAHLDDIVAVLTNNDKTVRVYSLPQKLETTVLDLPFAMNHATLSPDGRMLVAVGDFNQAYFFQRELQEVPPQIPKPHNRLTSGSVEWTLTSVVNLHIGTPENTTGFFTTAWNESGRLVAVGSEGGYITVFDTEMLQSSDYEDEEAIVAVVPSSRPDLPQPHPGAVRSMMFAPDPWDLLVWAEDQGRVCIGDLRTGLKSKQIVNLEPKDEALRRVVYEDVSPENTPIYMDQGGRDVDDLEADFIRRYRQAPDNATAVNFATEYIEARRRQRQHRQDVLRQGIGARARPVRLEDDPQGLTVREQQILETLRTTRQREEARTSGAPSRAVNYTTPDMFGSGNQPTSGTTSRVDSPAAAARPISDVLSSVPDSFPELARTSAASPGPSTASQREDEPQTNTLPTLVRALADTPWSQVLSSSQVRLGDGSRLPRRRASVVLTPPATGSTSTSTANTSAPRPSQTPRALPPTASAAEDEENPWRTIEAHMTLARGPLFEGAARAQPTSPLPAPARPTEQELQQELIAERTRARSLARQRDRWRALRAETAAGQQGTDSPGPAAPSLEAVRRISAFPEGYETLLRRSQLRGFTGREVGVRTAGLAMSADGKMLWCATEDGIFEVEINRKERMFWPSIEPR
ncbi:hypothetical protein B0A50_02267 [Salinomyces thailandicus]|uniref:DUF2415 domain-containing protein n=1 Tax=Salinomyces thailandicus TaxID=706561 RepID=A0A4U0U821_9PEZI|nr:hypothetical protein B0A50_02267 [Salinomyces thailandica]